MLLIIRGKHLRKIPREILDKVEEDVQKTKFADLVDTKEILISDEYETILMKIQFSEK